MFLERLFALCSVLTFFLLLLPRVPLSATASAESGPNEACLACHGQPEMRSAPGLRIYVDAAKHAASVHGSLGCTTCHTGIKDYPHPKRVARVDCAACHAEPAAELPRSVHAALGPRACANCHGTAHETQPAASITPQRCASCHAETVRDYLSAVHATARNSGDAQGATCQSCLGPAHRILSGADERSPVAKKNLPATCGSCHANPDFLARHNIPFAHPVEAYRLSVHGRAVAAGNDAAPSCSDCHSNHAIFAARDARSKTNHWNVPQTCGTCHREIQETYGKSVHGQAVRHGAPGAPVCTDCHGEHMILAPSEPESLVYPVRVSSVTCGRCHGDERLAQRYNLPADKVPAFKDSYHGLALRAGLQTVANCASCHGVHNILPSSDPRSTVHPANLARTCGSCHPGAGQRFAIGAVHVQPATTSEHASVKWIRRAYWVLIPLALVFMFFHNGLDFLAKLVRRNAPSQHAAACSGGELTRMNLHFRIAHWGVMLSFPTLVFTGFALKYPERWWARPLVLWESHVAFRGTVHRIAAVVLIAATAYHILHLAVNKQDRVFLAAMLPRWKDFRDLVQVFRYNLGLTAEEPKFAKFNYAEKVEYGAFLWGTAVMTLSGLLLWFNNFTLRHFPKWVADAATAVHFYEALLATFSILLWHFYMVIFDPVVYPMDVAWLTGKVHADHYRHTRPEYYRALRQAGLVHESSAEAGSAGKDAEPQEIKSPPRQN